MYGLLIDYLTENSRAYTYQKRAIIEDKNTLVNFAYLIGCIWYPENEPMVLLNKLELS